jgi:rRNA pseudouridine-1189 N-methylase Emg1 (Nep1/Mra1 family)
LLLIYLARINELADRPEFYHLLTNSCTINIVRYANAAGRKGRFDIRHLLNGLIDSYLYHSGRMDTTLPYEEVRRRSLINEAAQAADAGPDFSERIRASLPTIPH